ncbi:MAG: hypothetical protein AAB602_03650 [Patescibacteria group bacterium]
MKNILKSGLFSIGIITAAFVLIPAGAFLVLVALERPETEPQAKVSVHFGSDWVIDNGTVFRNENLEIVSVGYCSSDTRLVVTARWKSDTNTAQTFFVEVDDNRKGIIWVGIPDSELRAKVAKVQDVAKR